MKILLTGSTGFIGSHLKRRLEREGHDVHCYLKRHIGWPSDIKVVINCAAKLTLTDVKNIWEENMWESNTQLVYHLLEFARRGEIKMIQIGSSSELGPVEGVRAETDFCRPSNLYEATKLAATNICLGYAGEFDVDVCVARPFTVYGPGDKSRKFLPTLHRALIQGTPFTCYPGGHDWTHVGDFVDGLMLLLYAPREITKGQIFHFGTGINTSNEEIVKLFEQAAGRLPKITYVTERFRPYDVSDWRADTTKTSQVLGWNALMDVATGVKHFVVDASLKPNS